LIGHQFGANNAEGIRSQFQQCLWLCVPLAIIAGAALLTGRFALNYFDLEPEVLAIARAYLLPSAITTMLVPFGLCFRTTAEGVGLVRPVMLSSAFVFLVNIPLDYMLVLGGPGFDGMGGEGCGWASLMAFSLLLLIWIVYSIKSRKFSAYQFWSQFDFPRWSAMQRTLSLGVPIGLSQLALGGFFAMIPLLMTPLGTLALASHSVAIAVDMMMITIPIGLGQALSVRVSHSLGAGSPQSARDIAITGMGLVLALSVFQGMLVFLAREPIASLFSDDLEVIKLGSNLLIFAAVYRIADSLQLCAGMTLRGFRDTRVPSAINIIAYWLVGLPLCALIGLNTLFGYELGVYGFWLGMLLTITAAAILITWRLHRVSMRKLI